MKILRFIVDTRNGGAWQQTANPTEGCSRLTRGQKRGRQKRHGKTLRGHGNLPCLQAAHVRRRLLQYQACGANAGRLSAETILLGRDDNNAIPPKANTVL